MSIPIFLFGGTLRDFWDATLGYQADRASPFSIYGLWGGLDWLHTLAQVGAVGLGIAVAFVPRRNDLVGTAALAAAVLVAVQLVADLLVLPLHRLDRAARLHRAAVPRGRAGDQPCAGSRRTSRTRRCGSC